jgi:murein DD-endopeptidase
MQHDGNLVLRSHRNGHWVRTWSSHTAGHRGAFAELGLDGNFVVYGRRHALWTTNTAGHGRVILGVQSNGNVVMYKRSHGDTTVLGQTHTG